MITRRTFELFRAGEYVDTYDLYERAHIEAMCSRRPWQIFACEGRTARKIAEGDGSWRPTHELVTKRETVFTRRLVGTRFILMATPDGRLFTEGAWNRGDPPDFMNTGVGLRRGDGRAVMSSAILNRLQT